MSNQLKLQPGCPPWLPSKDAEQGKIFHYYDVPLVGMVREAATNYLFVCRYRGDDRLSVWMYVHVTDEDIEVLDSSASSETNLPQVLDRLEDRGDVAYALVDDDRAVVRSIDHAYASTLRHDLPLMIKAAALPAGIDRDAEARELLDVIPS